MNKDTKTTVKERYSKIAVNSATKSSCLCSCDIGEDEEMVNKSFSEHYENLPGYVPEADYGLGCGLPTEYAGIKEGDFVLDLGSGAGNDCFIARAIVGDKGYVAGIDFTEAMIRKAQANARKRNITNVDFVLGDIENIPVNLEVVDVVISNCVLNLVPDKAKTFTEIFRVLKPKGHFCISDVVTIGQLHEGLRNDAALYAGCVAGALPREEYIATIVNAGFELIEFNSEKRIDLPDELLLKYISPDELDSFKTGKNGIYSITLSASKPDVCACGCCALR